MTWTVDIWSIIIDYFRPYHMGEGRRFRPFQLIVKLGLPIALATALTILYPNTSHEAAPNLLTVFGVVVTVMTALLPIVQAVVGATTLPKNLVKHSRDWNHCKARAETLREIYAAIGWSVLSTMFALVTTTIAAMVPTPIPPSKAIAVTLFACSLIAFWAAFVAAVSLLQVLGGVYLLLRRDLDDLNAALDNMSE